VSELAAGPKPMRGQKAGRRMLARIFKNWELYLFLLPAFAFFAIFQFGPMYGLQLAFKDFVASDGIWRSPWIGLHHFSTFFSSYFFWQLLRNTVLISLYSLVASFPFPLLLALMLNEVKNGAYKKLVQTVSYAPHFISTVVMVGMIFIFLHPEYGLVNAALKLLGRQPEAFINKAAYFQSIYVWTGVWQSVGWSSVIYFATLASVDPQQHEAAIIDGASRLQRIWYINIPVIMPTAIILLILNAGQVMSVGFEKIYLMRTPLNTGTSEVFSTYIYKMGVQGGRYSFSTAVGLFNSAINCVVLIVVNRIAKVVSSVGVW
jgi:putative aldouronate transport system permease protein